MPYSRKQKIKAIKEQNKIINNSDLKVVEKRGFWNNNIS